MVRVFANGPGDLASISGRVIPKTQKMALDASLLITLSIIRYTSRVKWVNSEKRVAPSLGVVAIEKGTFRSPSTTVANNNFICVILFVTTKTV